mmetsp:Transcript_27763/g.36393  ORF Transcript_27763/g.36393 Transcript_27763/m.36393 type:complete len:232 (-) Transcript_27763:1642-2337(-)
MFSRRWKNSLADSSILLSTNDAKICRLSNSRVSWISCCDWLWKPPFWPTWRRHPASSNLKGEDPVVTLSRTNFCKREAARVMRSRSAPPRGGSGPLLTPSETALWRAKPTSSITSTASSTNASLRNTPRSDNKKDTNDPTSWSSCASSPSFSLVDVDGLPFSLLLLPPPLELDAVFRRLLSRDQFIRDLSLRPRNCCPATAVEEVSSNTTCLRASSNSGAGELRNWRTMNG